MAETVAVALSSSVYTALGTTQTAVGCFVVPGQRVRLSVATSLPAPTATGFIAVECTSGKTYEFVDFSTFGIGAGDEVYAMSDVGNATLMVLRGTLAGGGGGGGDASAANQATEIASLSIMDDWDETDRAKVNIIVGQAGVAAGAGAVGATVIRTTSASDDPAVAALTIIRSPGLVASATFTPAATSHVANDCNGAAGTFAFGAVSATSVIINSASLLINGATAEATAWRLYLYSITPPSAIADDGAWDLASGDQASFRGLVDLGTAVDLGSTQYIEVNGLAKEVDLAGTGLFGYLVNLTTLTPAAVAHTVKLNAIQV